MILYHGSNKIIQTPQYGSGKEDNDYGKGFYTTEDRDKANAWAVVNGNDDAICNQYELDINGLNILRLNDYGVLAWTAEVISHRGVLDENTMYIAEALVDKYKLDTSEYDIIIGYRADDSYTKVIDSFLQGQLTTDEVLRFFKKGELGDQVFIKSEPAFRNLKFIDYENVKNIEKYIGYDASTRKEVENFLNNRRKAIQIEGFQPKGITVQDAIKNDCVYNKEYEYFEIKSNNANDLGLEDR